MESCCWRNFDGNAEIDGLDLRLRERRFCGEGRERVETRHQRIASRLRGRIDEMLLARLGCRRLFHQAV